jgi:hypothetical protein
MHKSLFIVDHKVGNRWEPVGLFKCVNDESAIERAAWMLHLEQDINRALLRVTPLGEFGQPIKAK